MIKSAQVAVVGACCFAAAVSAATAQDIVARGVVAPRVTATLSAQISGRLAKLPVDRGRRVKAGDMLVEFDCALEQARAKAAQADLDGAHARQVNLQRLDRMGSVGKVEVQIAAAESAKAAAVLEERRAVLRYCVVVAPFDGVAVDTPVRAHESVEIGEPLITLLDENSLRIETLAPSNWTAWLKPGLSFRFTVDETGESFSAVVTHLDGRIDPGSQTITVFAEPRRAQAAQEKPTAPLLAGMTGSAAFDAATVPPAGAR